MVCHECPCHLCKQCIKNFVYINQNRFFQLARVKLFNIFFVCWTMSAIVKIWDWFRCKISFLCVQYQNESVSNYVAVLQKLAEHFSYGDYLIDILQESLLCWITIGRTDLRLLSEHSTLILERALDISLSVMKQTSEIQNSHSNSQCITMENLVLKKFIMMQESTSLNHSQSQVKSVFTTTEKGRISRACSKRAEGNKDYK